MMYIASVEVSIDLPEGCSPHDREARLRATSKLVHGLEQGTIDIEWEPAYDEFVEPD